MLEDIKKWSLNDRIVKAIPCKVTDLSDKTWFEAVRKRPGFDHSKEQVSIPAIFARFIGVDGDEKEYYGRIFDLHARLESFSGLYFKIDQGLDKRIAPETMSMLRGAWKPLDRARSIDKKTIESILTGSGKLFAVRDPRQHRQVVQSVMRTLEWYETTKGSGANPNEAKNIVFYAAHWFQGSFSEVLQKFDYSDINPKLIYYGELSKWESYFLLFLHFLGFDVIYFNTEDDKHLDAIDPGGKISSLITHTRLLQMESFPTEGNGERVRTDAHVASEELRDVLHSDDSGFYKPWQFVEYHVTNTILHTTADEVGILAPENAMVRTGWEVGQGRVTVPNIFAKFLGVYRDRNRYFKEINKLKNLPQAHFVEKLPTIGKTTQLFKKEYYSCLGSDKQLDAGKLMQAGFWPYKHLPSHLQKLIATHICELCQLKGLKRLADEPIENQKLLVFSVMTKLPDFALKLLQQFDFPFIVPKLILFNNEDNGVLSFEDAILMKFLGSAGLDIILYNPAGHNDIEIFIEPGVFDSHRLEEVEFNCKFKSRSLMGRFF